MVEGSLLVSEVGCVELHTVDPELLGGMGVGEVQRDLQKPPGGLGGVHVMVFDEA